MDIAVLLIIFNRLDTTKKVFEQIRNAKPKRLYIGADGPRSSVKDDKIKTEEVRKWVIDHIDWDCEVHTLFRKENLGIEKALPQAVSWMFETEDMGIILEDDCLPSLSFFEFCRLLLNKYKDNKRVRSISGSNFKQKVNIEKNNFSYSFCPLSGTWGWATWKRTWEDFDHDLKMKDWEEIRKDENLGKISNNKLVIEHLRDTFDYYYNNTITWDVEYIVNNLKHVIEDGAVNIGVPMNMNLISNIGNIGTHYSEETPFLNQELDEIDFDNFIDPPLLELDKDNFDVGYLHVMYLYIVQKLATKDTNTVDSILFKQKKDFYWAYIKYLLTLNKKAKARRKEKLQILKKEIEIIKAYKSEEEKFLLNNKFT